MRPGSSASSASCTHDASSTPAAAPSAEATLFSSTEPALIMDSRMPEAASRRSASRWARIAENAPASWTERYCATASSSSESSRRMGCTWSQPTSISASRWRPNQTGTAMKLANGGSTDDITW